MIAVETAGASGFVTVAFLLLVARVEARSLCPVRIPRITLSSVRRRRGRAL